MQQTQDWVRKTAGTPLFAVLANTHGAQAITAYYPQVWQQRPDQAKRTARLSQALLDAVNRRTNPFEVPTLDVSAFRP